MSFRRIVRDLRDGLEFFSRWSFDPSLSDMQRHLSESYVHELHYSLQDSPQSRWATFPPELLCDVIKRLDASETNWPSRKCLVACSAVCRSWRTMCKEIVRSPEFSGKLTFPVSLKQPGPRDGTVQCFIKRDIYNMKYHLYVSNNPATLAENGKFLMCAKRSRHATFTEFRISMEASSNSRSSSTYIGKLRSNFLGTKFIIYDTQPPYNSTTVCPPKRSSRRFFSSKVSPKVPSVCYNIAHVSYELNVLGTRGPRRMHCFMYSIPASALDVGGTVPGQPEQIVPQRVGDSLRRMSISKSSVMVSSMDFNSVRISDSNGRILGDDRMEDILEQQPLVLHNKAPRWHEQLQCWCLNFRGRVTIASVKNFQLIAASQTDTEAPAPSRPAQSDPDKVILQFGKVAQDAFTMDYRYPLSAFQAFAICLSSFDTKLACE